MPKNVDGEFEVLLGNRQLLSIFFVVVILLGVFFTLGYVLGHGSGSGGASPAASRKAAADAPASAVSGFPNTYRSDAVLPNAPAPAPSVPATSPPAPATPTPAAGTQPQPPAAAKPSVGETVPPVSPTEPVSGQTYLQVVAGRRADVDLVVTVLKKKGFRASTAPGPTEGVFRALVGPLADTDAVTKSRADLETAGFKPIIRRY